MSLFETEGIILKTYSLSEADKIVVLLTEKEGLIRGVAKGAKRLKSRFGGSLEPFTVVDVSFFQKEDKELVSIRQIELVKSYFETISEPHIFEKFSYLVELIAEFSPPHDPNEKLYRMVRVCLENGAEAPQFLENIIVYFEFWLLRLGGFLPNWDKCDLCKRGFSEQETTYLQANFHLFCNNCRKSSNQNLIDYTQRFIYKSAQKNSPEKFIEITENDSEGIRSLSVVLKKILSQILNREVSDKKILFAHT